MTWAAWVIGASGLLIGCNQIAGIGDFRDEKPTSTSGGGGPGGGTGTGATGGSARGGGGGGGGVGGGPDCVADVDTDPANCGACGVDCAGGLCTNGTCSPVEISLDSPGPIARLDGHVIVALGGTSNKLVAVPEDFSAASLFEDLGSIADALGAITAGPQRVYYSAQSAADVHSCTTTACVSQNVSLGNAAHFNSLALVTGGVDQLYLVASQPDRRLYTAPVDGAGVATGTPTVVLDDLLVEPGTDGPHVLQHVPQDQTFYLTTFGDGGCLYKIEETALPNLSMPVPCFASSAKGLPGTRGMFADATRVFVDTDGQVVQVDSAGEATMFGPAGASAPLAADGSHAYFGSANGSMYVLDDGGATLAIIGTGTIKDIDATHPDYVFYTAGSSLFRWRKLPPS